MIALTASVIVSRHAIAERQSVVGILSNLDDAERNAVRTMPARVGPHARVDVPVLVTHARRLARDMAEEERRRNPPRAWRYAITLMNADELEGSAVLYRQAPIPMKLPALPATIPVRPPAGQAASTFR